MNRSLLIVSGDAPNRLVNANFEQATGRSQLDYATWWRCLAAPGSRFAAPSPAPRRLVHPATLTRTAA